MFNEEEEGAIDTGESWSPPAEEAPQDNSGAAPVAAAPAAPAQAEPAIPTDDGPTLSSPGYGPLAGVGNAAKGGIKRIVSYLMGEGAADPQALDQVGAQVDPQGQMDPSDRNMAAVQKVAQDGGPEAAWKLVQANRVAYNAKQAFAYTALNGTQQKPPDLNAAIDAANQAASHVLDGSSVQFQPSEGGVTATVKTPGGEAQTIPLSMQAFREYLNVGRRGQYDRVMQDTVPGTLQKIAQGGGGVKSVNQLRPLPSKASQEPAIDNSESDAYTPPSPKTNFGKTPSTMNLSGSDEVQNRGPTAVEETNYGPELEARANRMFPGITQEAQRNAFMEQEVGRAEGNKNKVDVAIAGAESRVKAAEARAYAAESAARIRADADRDVADKKNKGWQYATDGKRAIAQINADQKAAHDGNVDARQRLESARKAIAAKRATMTELTPEEQELEKKLAAGGLASSTPMGQRQQPQQPQQRPQAAPQKQGSAQQPPVPGAKLYKGTWYTRGPNGESVPYQP